MQITDCWNLKISLCAPELETSSTDDQSPCSTQIQDEVALLLIVLLSVNLISIPSSAICFVFEKGVRIYFYIGNHGKEISTEKCYLLEYCI